ncbi:energy transducer TonB [Sandaracinobacteroides saxicola]|uniref:TonB family protein n=1 Tax=Sandaracinobacteroides saxicola TaxID=2759707 RepID=A0A7G5IL50_9SPHN|nr:energy transducer TonB [Sandaracinobacteroides saxicola]QMW24092.1 TonB family protein [Sandaracinobacteroides saxicola]
MSYLGQKRSKNNTVAIGIVVLLHIFLGYALISGLAVDVTKKILENIETKNVVEEVKPPEEPPPPPPKLEEIPPYVPPPDVVIQQDAPPAPTITVQQAVPQPNVAPTPAPVVQAPPAVPGTPAVPIARSFEVTDDDYPPASQRAGEEGVTGVQVTIGTDGRVAAGTCKIVTSSGFERLDARACQIAERRWRFKPATENGQPVTTTIRRNYRWQIKEVR